MNYKQIIDYILDVASKNISVNEVNEGDVYEILNSKQHRYPSIILTPQTVTSTNSDTETLNAILFFVDRLTDTQENKIMIQSQGISVLRQILEKCAEENIFDIESYTFTPFTEKFTDECAGVFVNITVNYTIDFICSEDNMFKVKTLNIDKNGIYNTIGYDDVDVNVAPDIQSKEIEITPTTNGSTEEIKPDEGYYLENVIVNVAPVKAEPYNIYITKNGDYTFTPADDTFYNNIYLKANVSGEVNLEGMNVTIDATNYNNFELKDVLTIKQIFSPLSATLIRDMLQNNGTLSATNLHMQDNTNLITVVDKGVKIIIEKI